MNKKVWHDQKRHLEETHIARHLVDWVIGRLPLDEELRPLAIRLRPSVCTNAAGSANLNGTYHWPAVPIMRRAFVYLSWIAFLLNVWSVCGRFEQMHPGALAGMGFSFLLTILTFGAAILASGMYRQKSGSLIKTEIEPKR